jgi:hypothetical protein
MMFGFLLHLLGVRRQFWFLRIHRPAPKAGLFLFQAAFGGIAFSFVNRVISLDRTPRRRAERRRTLIFSASAMRFSVQTLIPRIRAASLHGTTRSFVGNGSGDSGAALFIFASFDATV